MEYTNLQYFLFKLGKILNSAIFSVLVAIILAAAIVTYFGVQAFQEKPNLSSAQVKKLKLWKKISLVVFGGLVVILFIGRYFTDGVDGPNAVVFKNHKNVIVHGQVVKIDRRNATLTIVPDGKTISKGLTVKVNEPPVSLGAPNIEKYSGTHMNKNQFDKTNEGDYVKIQKQLATFKYKNHAKYGNDSDAQKQIKQFNDNDVNGEVIKTKSGLISYLYDPDTSSYESELE